jgi:feruloyl esterase
MIRTCLLFCLAVPLSVRAQQPGSCEQLTKASSPQLTISSATTVASGALQLPPGPLGPVDTSKLPAFCRVQGSLHPTSDSDIGFELWLPASGWNHRYMQLGNGGLAGHIDASAMVPRLAKGYAAGVTDDGHKAIPTDGSWAIGHPEKVKDFGYRAVHETSEAAKKLIGQYYGSPAKYSYFDGCSEGGREALMEAQRYPRDFNGILAGATAHYWTELMAAFAWNAHALNSAESFIPESKRQAITNAALAACPSEKGVDDKFIDDPLRCHYDPSVLSCKGTEQSDSCLTQPQIQALEKIYSGPKNPRTGAQISPGYEPGAEAEPGFPGVSFASYVFGSGPGASLDAAFSSAFYGGFVFSDPKWSFTKLNFDSDIAETEQKVGSSLNASDPDLSPFKAAGGKLLQYHGWYDGSPSPLHSVDYYEQVERKMGGLAATESFYRLYMVPGMMHCGLGPGPNMFGNLLDFAPASDPEHNIMLALEQWVEKGVPPSQIIATKYVENNPEKSVEMTRPLCSYPQVATWSGKGDPKQAANWKCKAQK